MPRKRANPRAEAVKSRLADRPPGPEATVTDEILPPHSKKAGTDGVKPLLNQRVQLTDQVKPPQKVIKNPLKLVKKPLKLVKNF